ncbi:MAG TPA: hypothetical protein VMZ52_07695 [Bryobacteraceae bacterium]|nr:hypothetical protein [Bryobacteraceae bacterium]
MALFLLLLVPSGFLAWRYRNMPQFGLHHDDAIYWVSAKSLAEGQGYRIQSMPAQPHQSKYPPAYPALLAGVWLLNPLFPQNLPLAALLSWLLFPAYLLLARQVFRDYGFGFAATSFLCLSIALNAMSLMLALSLMSDLFFCVGLLAVLGLAERGTDQALPWWCYLLLGILAGFTYLIRSVAAPLLVSVPLCFWLAKRRAGAVLFLTGMLPAMAGWQLWAKLHQSGNDLFSLYYTDYLGFYLKNVHPSEIPAMLQLNAAEYWRGIGQLLLFNVDDSFFARILAGVTAIAAVSGLIRLLQTSRRLHYAVYGVGLSLMLLTWHYAPSARFLFPLFPLLAAGLFTELRHVWHLVLMNARKPKSADRIAAYAIAVVLFCYGATWANLTWGGIRLLPTLMEDRVRLLRDTAPVYSWVREHTLPSDTFLAYDDAVLYLETGRRGLTEPIVGRLLFAEDEAGKRRYVEALPAAARDAGLTHLLLTNVDFYRDLHERGSKALREAADSLPFLRLEYSDAHNRVYKILR